MAPQEDLLGNVAPSRNGEAAAAIVAAGVGCAVFGILVVLLALSTAIETLLTFSVPVGSLSGKTIIAVGVWLISWFALHRAWKDKHLDQRKTFIAAAILVGLGVLGTFPRSMRRSTKYSRNQGATCL
jgi:fumarate reductase subunit D